MGKLGRKKLLLLAGIATVIVAPLSVMGWYFSGSNNKSSSVQTPNGQEQQIQEEQTSQLGGASPDTSAAKTSKASSDSSSKTTITVNGQEIPLSPNGHTHTVIQNGSSSTTLDVTVSNNVSGGAGAAKSHNSVNLYSYSHSVASGQSANN